MNQTHPSVSARARYRAEVLFTLSVLVLTVIGLPAVAETADSKVDCDRNSRSRGDWRSGTESRQEAEQYLISELNQSLSRPIECAKQAVSESSGAGGTGGAAGGLDASIEVAGGAREGSGSGAGAATGVETAGPVAVSGRSANPGGIESARGDSRAGTGAPGDVLPRSTTGGSPTVGSTPGGESVGPVEVDTDGSYAEALREAYAKETDPSLRAAIEDEYRKLTGKPLSSG